MAVSALHLHPDDFSEGRRVATQAEAFCFKAFNFQVFSKKVVF